MNDDGLKALTYAQLVAVRDAYLAGGDAASAAIFTREINARYVKILGFGAVGALVLWLVLK